MPRSGRRLIAIVIEGSVCLVWCDVEARKAFQGNVSGVWSLLFQRSFGDSKL
jgi:hypothetical protein